MDSENEQDEEDKINISSSADERQAAAYIREKTAAVSVNEYKESEVPSVEGTNITQDSVEQFSPGTQSDTEVDGKSTKVTGLDAHVLEEDDDDDTVEPPLKIVRTSPVISGRKAVLQTVSTDDRFHIPEKGIQSNGQNINSQYPVNSEKNSLENSQHTMDTSLNSSILSGESSNVLVDQQEDPLVTENLDTAESAKANNATTGNTQFTETEINIVKGNEKHSQDISGSLGQEKEEFQASKSLQQVGTHVVQHVPEVSHQGNANLVKAPAVLSSASGKKKLREVKFSVTMY